jgi:hypothetical protein
VRSGVSKTGDNDQLSWLFGLPGLAAWGPTNMIVAAYFTTVKELFVMPVIISFAFWLA